MDWPCWEMGEDPIMPDISQSDAEEIARRHMNLAERVVRWFGFDRRREIVFGPHYNQVARDLYVDACRLTGEVPHNLD